MKVIIGIPSGDMVFADFAMSLTSIVSNAIGQRLCDIALCNVKSSIVEKGRHDIVENAIEAKADKILFLDTDMVFPFNTLSTLLSHNKEIVGCNYSTRRAPIKGVVRDLNEKLMYDKNGLIEVGFVATGCLLVDVNVFKKIGKPYFKVPWCNKLNKHIGEDYTFSKMARAHGFKLYCDFDLSQRIQHLGTVAYDLNLARDIKRVIEE